MDEEALERRKRSRARRKGRPTEDEEAGAPLSVGLPRRMRSQTVLLLISGGAALVAVILAPMEGHQWLVPAGVMLVFGTVFLFAEVDAAVVEVRGDPDASTIALVLRDRGEVVLPRSAIERARVSTHSSGSGSQRSASYGVALRKADAGTLTLCRVGSRRDRAEAVVEDIDELLDNVAPDEAAEQKLLTAARDRLEDSDQVRIERLQDSGGGYRDETSEALRVSWPLAPRPRSVLLVPGAFGGIATVILGFAAPAAARMYVAVVLGGLLLVSMVLHLRKHSMTRAVSIDDQHMTLTKERGSKAADEKRIPLVAVNAVDLAWTGPLMLRVDEANEEIQHLSERADGGKRSMDILELPRFLRSVLAIARQSIHIETGPLGFEERLDLETLLGAEVARRTGRSHGAI